MHDYGNHCTNSVLTFLPHSTAFWWHINHKIQLNSLPQSTNTVCMLYHLRAKFSPNLLSYLHTINTQQMHMITITAFTKFKIRNFQLLLQPVFKHLILHITADMHHVAAMICTLWMVTGKNCPVYIYVTSQTILHHHESMTNHMIMGNWKGKICLKDRIIQRQ